MMLSVQAGRILALSILAGLIAGGVLAALNLAIVQPYLALVSEDILDELIAEGEYFEEEFDSKLALAYSSQTWGAVGMGLAAGALIGGARVLDMRGNNRYILDAVVIVAVAWFVLYVVPGVKYPASPTAIFDEDAGSMYYPLYFGYMAVSGLAALGIVAGFQKVSAKNKLFAMAALYLVVIAIAFFIFPPYELDDSFDQQLLNSWRASISAAMTAFWFAAGLIAGLLWKYGSSRKR